MVLNQFLVKTSILGRTYSPQFNQQKLPLLAHFLELGFLTTQKDGIDFSLKNPTRWMVPGIFYLWWWLGSFLNFPCHSLESFFKPVLISFTETEQCWGRAQGTFKAHYSLLPETLDLLIKVEKHREVSCFLLSAATICKVVSLLFAGWINKCR